MDVAEEGEQVIFLRKVVPGGADRSYGIHVAQIAGIPQAIIRRAQDVLADLEREGQGSGNRRKAMARQAPEPLNGLQLTFLDQPQPAIERLKALDVESLSPLEAITVLFELKSLTREGSR